MADSEKPGEGEQKAQAANTEITQPAAPPPQQPPAGSNTGGAGDDPRPAQPILVQLVGGDDLEPFEEQSLAISRETLEISRRTDRIAILGFLIALAAAVFVAVQVFEMTKQTQILASQSESASASSLLDGMNTRRQLAIAQQQANILAKQLMYNQKLGESQRASIEVAFASVNNPITFHESSLSIVFSITLKNVGRLTANKVKVRFKPYFSKWGETIFTEPMRQQRDFCAKPNVLRLRKDYEDLRGLTMDDALTIIPDAAKEWQINFGMGATNSDIIDWPPSDVNLPQTKRVYPIVVGCVDYQSGSMPEAHQTGFIFEIQRKGVDSKMPTFIHLGEDVPRENVVVTQYFFGQGKSY